ncbi:NUDIX domain-containing protein [Planococcus lenghuensis]|uniref:Nudix hydrolase domain-containing protein n=1 Tax=Planococcus lenghuensis TaxID=2213202 RepID=A0A1Q2KYS6_9BACL|nr:NUDIX domain-containing protein [Planococcus lenghuensis]AQQ53303.1 hypothetical protein B0X71_09580 [Planococcus lenghuensis]
MTQRDAAKSYPLLWEGTGGSVTAGETSRMGAIRELEEETGLIAEADELLLLSEQRYSHYFLDYYIWASLEPITPDRLHLQKGEVCGAKLVTVAELDEMNNAGFIVPPVWERFNLHRENINAFIGGLAVK